MWIEFPKFHEDGEEFPGPFLVNLATVRSIYASTEEDRIWIEYGKDDEELYTFVGGYDALRYHLGNTERITR